MSAVLTNKMAKDIQNLADKKFRDEKGLFKIEGPKLVDEFLSSDFKINCIVATKNWLETHFASLPTELQAHAFEVSPSKLQSLSSLKTANQVIAVVHKSNPSFIIPKDKVSIVLDDIQDPGNMGTIIRIADWFGIEQIFCSLHSVDCYNSKVVQSTMGSLLRVKIYYTDIEELFRTTELPVYAALLHGESIFEMKKVNRGFLLIGNESKGIHPSLLNSSIFPITIPKVGAAESLNAAVATGIIVSQILTR